MDELQATITDVSCRQRPLMRAGCELCGTRRAGLTIHEALAFFAVHSHGCAQATVDVVAGSSFESEQFRRSAQVL